MAYKSVGKGQCPVCKNWKPAIKDGEVIVMARHYAAREAYIDRDGRCLGGGEFPIDLRLND